MAALETAFGLIALAIMLVVPGYFITLGFFPRKKEIDGIERLTFSFVFSIAFMPLAVLIENQLFSVPINQQTAVATFLFLVLIGVVLWAVRVGKIPLPKAFYRLCPKIKKEEAVSLLPFR